MPHSRKDSLVVDLNPKTSQNSSNLDVFDAIVRRDDAEADEAEGVSIRNSESLDLPEIEEKTAEEVLQGDDIFAGSGGDLSFDEVGDAVTGEPAPVINTGLTSEVDDDSDEDDGDGEGEEPISSVSQPESVEPIIFDEEADQPPPAVEPDEETGDDSTEPVVGPPIPDPDAGAAGSDLPSTSSDNPFDDFEVQVIAVSAYDFEFQFEEDDDGDEMGDG